MDSLLFCLLDGLYTLEVVNDFLLEFKNPIFNIHKLVVNFNLKEYRLFVILCKNFMFLLIFVTI